MENDAELQSFISNGWPDKRSRLARNLQSYWNYHDELTIESGILVKNYKILIPATLRKKYLEKIHAGHQKINSCLKKANEFVFWVGHIQDITEIVEKCTLFQEQQKVSSEKFKFNSDIPAQPWHTLGSVICSTTRR